jgi:hypothetical protein
MGGDSILVHSVLEYRKYSAKCLEIDKIILTFAANYLIRPRIDMETTKKRTREEVRAAFKAFMREKEEERKAAQIRLELYHQKRLAGLV